MQDQQQFSVSLKQYDSTSKHNQNQIITIQQIYEVDTITLEQLLEDFENQSLSAKSILVPCPQNFHFNKKTPNFRRMTTRQLKKWHQLAKLQLIQRKKIEDFALKLLQDDFQIPTDDDIFNPFLKIKRQSSITKHSEIIRGQSHQFTKKSLNKENSKQKQQTVLKLPPIKNSVTPSQFLLSKNQILAQSQQKRKNLEPKIFGTEDFTQKYQNKNQKSCVDFAIKIKQRKQEQNLIQIQKIAMLHEGFKTIQVHNSSEIIKNSSKVVSRKEFMQMMKLKLSQGTEYKTSNFIKQVSKCNLRQNKSTKRVKKETQQRKKINQQQIKNQISSFYLRNKEANKDKKPEKNKKNNFSAISSSSGPRIINCQHNHKHKNVSSLTFREIPQSSNKKLSEFKNVTQNLRQQKDQEHNLPLASKALNANSEITPILHKQCQSDTNCLRSEIQSKPNQIETSHESQLQTKQSQSISLIKNTLEQTNFHQSDLKADYSNIFRQNQDAYDDQPQFFQQKVFLNDKLVDDAKSQCLNQIIDSTTEAHKINDYTLQRQRNLAIDQGQPQNTFEINQTINNLEINKKKQSHQINQKFLQTSQKFTDKFNQHLHLQTQSSENISIKQQKQTQTLKPNSIKQSNIQEYNATKLKIVESLTLDCKISSKIPAYHLQFPSFFSLFNLKSNSVSANSKISLAQFLKGIELSLEIYFDKKVREIAEKHMSSKIGLMNTEIFLTDDINEKQPNIELKCINQLQFLNTPEGQSIFNIDLSSFQYRSYNLLKNFKSCYLSKNVQLKYQKKIQSTQKQTCMFYRVVKNKPEVYDIINTAFYRAHHWRQLPHGMDLHACWNLLWTWSKPQVDFSCLIKFQKVNHFPGSKQLARKDLLKKNIEKIKKQSKKLSEFFDIIPETFFLPGENTAFIKKFRQSQQQDKNLWILKPVGLSRGRGISLINKLQEIIFSEPIVMQKYINHPFLLNGYKFDLRIYVLVTSINPLECFIYQEGFARVSTEKYSCDLDSIGNKFVHLTNYSIQKESMSYPSVFTEKQKQLGGCKLTLKMLRDKFQLMNVQWDQIWTQIQQVVLKSLISCMKYIPHNPSCFQLFGYDIMLDKDLKCWLIEVNSSPSLQKDFMIDQIIKQQLVDDIIQVVEPVEFNREQLLKVIRRRRKQCEGLKSHVNHSNNSVEQLNQDLYRILQGRVLRNYGEIKKHKNFLCIAPGQMYEKILKAVQHYTHDPFVKNMNFY